MAGVLVKSPHRPEQSEDRLPLRVEDCRHFIQITSNHDPLVEFAHHLVAAALAYDGTLGRRQRQHVQHLADKAGLTDAFTVLGTQAQYASTPFGNGLRLHMASPRGLSVSLPSPNPPENPMGLPLRDIEHHSYADYVAWPDDARYELIDGIAYAMSPAPTRRHQEVAGEIFRHIAEALEGSPCRPYIAPFDVRLPHGDKADDASIDTVVQPDISVICDRSKLDERGCVGAPDWIIEVLSPGTASHDQIVKRALYERAGVREYWLVHPVDRIVTIYLLDQGAYGRPDVRELVGELAPTVLPEVLIPWERVLREI